MKIFSLNTHVRSNILCNIDKKKNTRTRKTSFAEMNYFTRRRYCTAKYLYIKFGNIRTEYVLCLLFNENCLTLINSLNKYTFFFFINRLNDKSRNILAK